MTLLKHHVVHVRGGIEESCTSAKTSLIKTSAGGLGTTIDKIKAAPMACDAAMSVLLKDMMIWRLLFTRSFGLISLSAL